MAKKPTYIITQRNMSTGNAEKVAIRLYRCKKQPPKGDLYELFERVYVDTLTPNGTIPAQLVKRNKEDGSVIYMEHFEIDKKYFALTGIYINEASARGLFPGWF